ncbi:hypothetical protein [Rodentibacter pneumotropicus]|uniref:Uncharacterized protein n=1 Tax=Rodentibacter pneumotropicus TaxID=758 RepID=A0A4S2Q1U6_9PAST|nr:hypothetical protein [Rodentibacter pneumotropicus]THA10472.1 hypothetical protein D3M78_02935 [Rodentibacter pneumotropicus]
MKLARPSNAIDLKNESDIAALSFIKTVYAHYKYDKEKVRAVFHPDVVEAVMLTIDLTERGFKR